MSFFCGFPMSDPKLPPGTNYCLCNVCGAYFSGVKAFDRHRVGSYPDRSCLGPVDMSERGFQINAKGYWSV